MDVHRVRVYGGPQSGVTPAMPQLRLDVLDQIMLRRQCNQLQCRVTQVS